MIILIFHRGEWKAVEAVVRFGIATLINKITVEKFDEAKFKNI